MKVADIQAITSNPIYTGIGRFERAIPDSLWIKSAKIAIDEDGLEEFLRHVAWNLECSFGVKFEDEKGWVQDAKSVLEKHGVEKGLQNMLLFFRDFFGISNIRKSYMKWRIDSPI